MSCAGKTYNDNMFCVSECNLHYDNNPRTGWMEAFENTVKEKADKVLMVQNAPVTDTRLCSSSLKHISHSIRGSSVPGMGLKKHSRTFKNTRSDDGNHSLSLASLPLDYFDTYMHVRNARPDLMQTYRASLTQADTIKDAQV